ncbi:phytoene desaturase family protein [Flavobacterium gawalongense]|uniref:Phytoene desaturase n=1 Tax=Flavobacterium gawalongense TaxID=2594432 RepID=A0A553BL62_9FLAO|nr:phytoene desaturase family protein [Flavobacterium gawalongense]TRX00388.1 phytoene desaturase [Flavobacterium gawalongense]TRX05065.1 phytoene desaturase [Flavobacterium gawalongense]TRX08984.1 phytoene desaturase [Flavobacterium gawalongense]TRX10029.1 phytoene desaturase [Flavobacterium gawalongense]TRX26938.1 phytoene desaturase [Flavobacterium gawalongense]
MKKKITIIGSGFSALAASCYLAKSGHQVAVFEKNATIGGRARQLKRGGFTFDMGPSWYWMPDVFDRFFADFGKKTSDYYELIKLSPAYRVYYGIDDFITIADNLPDIISTFEAIEKGSGKILNEFMAEAKSNYDIAIKDLVYRPGVSPLELITVETVKKLGQFFSNISKEVHKKFKNERLIQILEFPVLFLGAKPSDTPSFYSFMNYADFGLGTWHPKTGMFDVVRAIESLARELGVTFHTNSNIERIIVEDKVAKAIVVNGETIASDLILSGADYHHTETLLDLEHRAYSEKYWDCRVFAPSSLLFYIGFDKKIKNISHHALFFDVDFYQHAKDIYDEPQWPKEPLFYANFPSLTDKTAAPEGMETGFFLVPLAPGITDTEELREEYFNKIMDRFETITQQSVKNNIIFKQSFCKNDFVSAYNSYKGNAYGMANTLLQTAFLRPKLKSKKVKNLYFTGQLTVPGPGVPPALISGKLVSELINKQFLEQ